MAYSGADGAATAYLPAGAGAAVQWVAKVGGSELDELKAIAAGAAQVLDAGRAGAVDAAAVRPGRVAPGVVARAASAPLSVLLSRTNGDWA